MRDGRRAAGTQQRDLGLARGVHRRIDHGFEFFHPRLKTPRPRVVA
jgi:hypothetical protein